MIGGNIINSDKEIHASFENKNIIKKRYTITLNENVVKEAKKKAIDENISFSKLIEKLLKNYLKIRG